MAFKEPGKPHYLGHRERLRRRFREAGPTLELILFRAAPRRDTKPLAEALIARFDTFAETVNAPEGRCARSPASARRPSPSSSWCAPRSG